MARRLFAITLCVSNGRTRFGRVDARVYLRFALRERPYILEAVRTEVTALDRFGLVDGGLLVEDEHSLVRDRQGCHSGYSQRRGRVGGSPGSIVT